MRSYVIRIAAILTVLASSQFAFAEGASGVQWRSSLEQAEREATSTGKPMLIQMTATWCTYCHKMLRTTFTDKAVIDLVNDNFIPIQVDADRNPQLVKALRIQAFPSTAIVSSDFQKILKINGYQKANKYKAQLTSINTSLSQQNVQTASVQSAPARPAVAAPEVTANIQETAPAPPQLAANPFEQVVEKPIVAFDQKCIVTLLDNRKLVVGKSEFSSQYNGKTVQFASQEAKSKFDAAPSNYWPANDGQSPVSSATSEGNPMYGVAYQGKIYFCSSQEELDAFQATPAKFVK